MAARILLALFLLLFVSATRPSSAREEQEKEEGDTYSISLVQTAETDKELHEIDGRKVLAETYEIAEGDHIWSLLRKRGLLQDRNLPRLLAMLKKLNSSLSSLDLIYPGQRIIIPLKISPLEPPTAARKEKPPVRISPQEINDIDFKNYTIEPGDSLIKVITGKYDIPMENLHNEYLDMVRKLNPALNNIDRIYPGQVVKLPVYTQEVVRSSIKPPPLKASRQADKQEMMTLGRQLKEVFTRMGEEWLQAGEQFIPLKPGGEIKLKTESYPIIDLANGHKIVVDLYNDLPEKMVKLIESNWDFYKIVKLSPGATLSSALKQILPLCGYDRLYPAGTPYDLGGDIGLHLKADWIIRKSPPSGENGGKLVMLHLSGDREDPVPGSIKKYLRTREIESVVFPSVDAVAGGPDTAEAEPLNLDDRPALVAELLKSAGRRVSPNVEIPVYQKQEKGFNLIVRADFLFKEQGRDCLIDLHGLDKNTISLLTEHHFKVLSLGQAKEVDRLAARILEFINIQYDSHPHNFQVFGSGNNEIQLTIPGITFRGEHDQDILITHLNLPREVVQFLAAKGYKVLIVEGTEARGQRSEARDQRPEIRDQRSEIRGDRLRTKARG